MTTELKEGDVCIFIRDSTCAGHFFGEEGDIIVLGPHKDKLKTSFAISGLPEYCKKTGARRSWYNLKNQVVAYTRDLKKIEPVDVGDLEDDF